MNKNKSKGQTQKLAVNLAERALSAQRGSPLIDAVEAANARIEAFTNENPRFRERLVQQRDHAIDAARLAATLAHLGIDDVTTQALLAINAHPALAAYRPEAELLRKLPALNDASLNDALATVQTVRSHSARTAAKCKPAPAWHAEAKRERDRLIQQGTAPRDVASKIARLLAFAAYSEHAIRAAIRRR